MKRHNDKVSVWRVFFFIALVGIGGVLTSTLAWAQQVQGSGDTNLGGTATRDPANQFTLDGGATWQDAYILNVPHPSYTAPMVGTRYISEDPTGTGVGQTTRRYRTIIWPCSCREGRVPALTSFLVHTDNAASLTVNGSFIGAQEDLEIAANFQGTPEDLIVAPFTGPGGPVLLNPGPNILEFDIHNFNSPAAFDYLATVKCIKEPQEPR